MFSFEPMLPSCPDPLVFGFGAVEAMNANLKSLLRRGRGYRNLRYLLLKARRMAATNTEFIAVEKAA